MAGLGAPATFKNQDLARRTCLLLSAAFAVPIFLGTTIGYWGVRGQTRLAGYAKSNVGARVPPIRTRWVIGQRSAPASFTPWWMTWFLPILTCRAGTSSRRTVANVLTAWRKRRWARSIRSWSYSPSR